jgi:hypothetical protein
MNAN